MMLVAFVIDDSLINWAIGLGGPVIVSIGGGIWMLWRQFIAFIKPKVTAVFTSHTDLVDEMKKNVPVVGEALNRLSTNQEAIVASQVQQCETLQALGAASKRHEEMHEKTGQKLELILTHLSAPRIQCPYNPDTDKNKGQ